ncbi:MAG: hypothetical protein CME59_22605 [Halioglobus sp.]|nr:hypothetical protein [Halioglobus sp.]|tara:strand:+ start:1169 stop:1558 length:390 start_codon:yes stop_codon:yes gene_type:complete
MKQKRHFDATAIFKVLVEAVAVFRGPQEYKHPQANFMGCYVGPCTNAEGTKRKRMSRNFAFVSRHGHEVIMEIDFALAARNPELYFTNLMEHLDRAMRQVNAGGTIFLPAKSAVMSKAVRQASNDAMRA